MGKCDNCPINYRDFSPMSLQLPQKPVKVIKGDTNGRKHHILRFNTPTTLKLDDILSDNVSMNRIVDEKHVNQEVKLEGEGSEFGWKSKQARLAHKYKVKAITEEQCPWELKDCNEKTYLGRKEGGITANSSYIIMREAQPGIYEAFPVEDWFTFTPKINYTTLNDEEAEEEFLRRNKTQNHYNLMLQKRLNTNLGSQSEYENAQLKVHDAEDLDSDDANEDINEDSTKKRKKKLKKFAKSKDKDDEELDKEKDDEDQYDAAASHEVDYISESESDDSIDLNSEKPDTVKKSEIALKVEGQTFQESDNEDEEENSEMKKLLLEHGEDESGSDVDENSEEFKALMLKNKANTISKESKLERSASPAKNGKEPPSKKQKTDKSEGSNLTEENVWRYLARKPISTKELIAKFKSKKSGLNKQEMVYKLSSILKKIAKQFMKDGKNYFVLKDEYKNLYKE